MLLTYFWSPPQNESVDETTPVSRCQVGTLEPNLPLAAASHPFRAFGAGFLCVQFGGRRSDPHFQPIWKNIRQIGSFSQASGENKKSIQKPTNTAPKHWIFLATNRRIDVYRMVTTTLRNITPETNPSRGRRKTYSRGLQPYVGFCEVFEVDKNTENDLKNQAKRIMVKSKNEKVITSW